MKTKQVSQPLQPLQPGMTVTNGDIKGTVRTFAIDSAGLVGWIIDWETTGPKFTRLGDMKYIEVYQ